MTMTTDDGVRGGWVLQVRCAVPDCTEQAEFRGFILSQAADAATTAGWQVDNGELHRSERAEICPVHAESTHRLVDGQVVEDTGCRECRSSDCEGFCEW